MGRIPACVGPPLAARCGPTPADDAEDIPARICRSAPALAAIMADVTDPGGLPKQLAAEATVVIRMGEDGRLHSRPITDPGRAGCQQDAA